MQKKHSFHIPVMGIGFTIDTPLKVSPYGMDSVLSVGDDILMEKLRKMYCTQYRIPYQEITNKIEDFRAKRITSYLNLIKELAEEKFEDLKAATLETGAELKKYFSMLPDGKALLEEFNTKTKDRFDLAKANAWLKRNLSMGSIDINIMTKLDKVNYKKDEKLPIEYNDAHAALRGFAKSTLNSSVIFSAGLNPRLYSYIEQFDDFYSDGNELPKKRIVLKVSDFRSALVQGRFLAKKGLWVSEYRIESGLNCGGHAFATNGFLIGPILKEFKDKRDELIDSNHMLMAQTLEKKNKSVPDHPLPLKITAQGGVGTSEEHDFLLDEYNLDSIGWGSPFLLVPEATSVDKETIEKLANAKEKDLYLSKISPLGVPFNNLRGNTKDGEKIRRISMGKPGSPCPKKYLALNTEFTDRAICTASRQYQRLKLNDLEQKFGKDSQEYEKWEQEIKEKSCICVGLGTSALLAHNIDPKVEGHGVSVCPGPNMAYFNQVMTLSEMTDHIYGRTNVNISETEDRPHMFVKEIEIYIDYIMEKLESEISPMKLKSKQFYETFVSNLNDGVDYYLDLFKSPKHSMIKLKSTIIESLIKGKNQLASLASQVNKIEPVNT